MGLLSRVANWGQQRDTGQRSSIDTWLSEYLIPAQTQFTYGGVTYPGGLRTTWGESRVSEISSTLPGYSAALRRCPPAFAAQLVRAAVLSQVRFTFRNPPGSPTPRRTFGSNALATLEAPWLNATTAELVARMEWHAGLAGNAYVTRQRDPGDPNRTRLRVLRPDWVGLVFGSDEEPKEAAHALDGRLLGFVYANGGLLSGNKVHTILPQDMAHWCPIPDSELAHIGASWITPAVREIQGDVAATEHKLQFFARGATPNLVVKGIPAATREQFDEIVAAMEAQHAGVANAYRTLYLTAGADATVVGANLQQMDFKSTQGAGETRIASLSRVPAALLGISEGLAGSSLNAGNFGMARRIFADTWVYPALQDLAASLATVVDVPRGAELWFDTADMPILREDGKDAADIELVRAQTITMYVREGFTAQSAVAAVRAQDVSLLRHTNMVSVQLQTPGTGEQTPPAGKAGT